MIYNVTQEGLTSNEAKAIATAFRVDSAALADNGAFDFVDPANFAKVPLLDVGTGVDESGQPTVSQALDANAIGALKPLDDDAARQRAGQLLEMVGLGSDLAAKPDISHTTLTLANDDGIVTGSHALDTTVSYSFSLAGLAVSGQGARLRITFGADGAVTQLSHALRKIAPGERVDIINSEAARAACAALYPAGAAQDSPTLGYQFPELTAVDASGHGSIKSIYPQYTCHARTTDVVYPDRLLPAVQNSGPSATLVATLAGNKVTANVSATGGTAPYSYVWSTSSGPITGNETITYDREARDTLSGEGVSVQVSDANQLVATATLTLATDETKTVQSVPGGGGLASLSTAQLDAGVENMEHEGGCAPAAHASAQGFHDVMSAHSVTVQFDWRGPDAWETDFKDDSKGGADSNWVDDVDIQWYTGHGGPGGFTFKTDHTDKVITPADARWGNRDLEWLQLESCEVLKDTNGKHDYFARWWEVFVGLHMLNGFHTGAACVAGGTGRAFATNLFPAPGRAAMTVRNAWAAMAIAKEPKGVVYRSMGPIGAGNVMDIGDYFWGQGPVGPDITAPVGLWAIAGTV